MSAEDLAKAFVELDDESVRTKVEGGNFDEVGELTDVERSLLADAAAELSSDVEGFANYQQSAAYRVGDYVKGQLTPGTRELLINKMTGRFGIPGDVAIQTTCGSYNLIG